jgi:hypothetical protein
VEVAIQVVAHLQEVQIDLVGYFTLESSLAILLITIDRTIDLTKRKNQKIISVEVSGKTYQLKNTGYRDEFEDQLAKEI